MRFHQRFEKGHRRNHGKIHRGNSRDAENRFFQPFCSLGSQNFCTDAVKSRFYNISATKQKQNAKTGIV